MEYSVSKAAATHLVRNLVISFVNLQISINLIVPRLYSFELRESTKSDEKGHVSMEGREKLWEDGLTKSGVLFRCKQVSDSISSA